MQKHVAMFGLILLALIALRSGEAMSQGTKTGRTLEVRVRYTGSSTVDKGHPIYVALWDSRKFVEQHMTPIQLKVVTSSNGTAMFSDVASNEAYVSLAFDPKGEWKATTPPPLDAIHGLHAEADGNPAAVKLTAGKTTSIDLKFGDAMKKK